MSEPPVLSVVVALISGKTSHLRRCLEALTDQRSSLALEVLVPFDRGVEEVTGLQPEFPEVAFIPVERRRTIATRDGRVREHHDRLRTVGIGRAQGRVIALTEDHAYVSPDWCAEMVAALERLPKAGAVGGAVDCDSDSSLNWAVYFCDFGRYQSPVPEGAAEFVSDANVVYRRSALDQAGGGWREDYHETVVHAALVRNGHQLSMTSSTQVWQARGRLGLWASLRERFVWGKSYAGGRAHETSLSQRLFYAVFSPALPFLLTLRLWRTASARGRGGRLLRVLPLVFLLNSIWAIGELAGYVTGRP